MNRTIRLIACCLAFSFSASIATAASSYVVTDLGTLGGTFSVGYALNSHGHVTGWSTTANNAAQHAFLYDGVMHDLGTLNGMDTFGYGINDRGQVAGSASKGGAQRAFLYDGTMRDIGTLSGNLAWGYGINNSGVVSGYSSAVNSFGNSLHAFKYDGTMHDLGTFGGPYTSYSFGRGINDSGQVTGDAGAGRGFIYDGTLHQLGKLPGGSGSFGYGINNNGQITGYADLADRSTVHAFLYDGTMHDIGTLAGATNSYGVGINDKGQVTGYAELIAGGQVAFLYDSQHGMVDLNTLIDPTSGWYLRKANAINYAGQIVGLGTIDGQSHAFLMTPVPEPTTFTLAILALGGIVARAWKCSNAYPRAVSGRGLSGTNSVACRYLAKAFRICAALFVKSNNDLGAF